MEFKDFESSFVKENRKLKIIIGITLLLTSIVITMMYFQKRYFIYKGANIFEERLLNEEICLMGLKTLSEGDPNPHMVTDEIIKLVEKEPLELPIDKILRLYSSERNKCKVVLKSDGKLLSFLITLEESEKFPFFYKLNQLDELSTNEDIL